MTDRPNMAALIAAGRSDAAIAHAMGVDRGTVHRARRRIAAGKDPVGRLAVEEVPTGTALRRRPWTPAEQAQHRADLLAALREPA